MKFSTDNRFSPHGAPATYATIRRVTWVGLVLNLLLTGIKFLAGTFGHSQAVVADAVHSLSDTATDLAILIGVRYWSAPADQCHPHGHNRYETLVTVLIGAILAIVGVGLIGQALMGLRDCFAPNAVHGATPEWIAFWAAIVSVAVKEGLFRWTREAGKRVKSAALTANAWHHRSDALSSIPAAMAVAGAAISPSWRFLDPIGAVVVSWFVLQAAWRIVAPALSRLADRGAPSEECRRIGEITLETPGVENFHALRTRYMGSGLQIDLHVQVHGAMSVRQGHDISTEVKERLIRLGPDVFDVVVHLEPVAEKPAEEKNIRD